METPLPSQAAYPLVNRELSWLAFSDRVLQEARDPSVPLFERLTFLAIFSSNLDEFFRVRVAYWRSLLRLKKKRVKQLPVSPSRLLREIHKEVHRQQEMFGETFRGQILPELERHGISLINESAAAPHHDFLAAYFRDSVLPLLRPVMLGHSSTPFLRNRGIYMVVELWPAESITVAAEAPHYALVEVPSPPLDRFVVLPGGGGRIVMFLDDVIRHNLPLLFPGWEVGGAHAVKLSRDAELHIEDEFSGDLVEAIRKSLEKRETGPPIRFLYDLQASHTMVSYLKDLFGLEDEDLFLGGRYHNLHDLRDFPRFGLTDLSFEPWPPLPHPQLEGASSVLEAVGERDQLVHFPYQSYAYVVRFLTEAAADPDVLEIWLTVYRVSRDSAVLNALLRAAERGKKVRVFVEVQARFDEESNLRWAERLERAGVVTIYSIHGIKVHAKLALVVRREGGARRQYAYLGTGNFNEDTARFYTDFGLLTADARITGEVEQVFHYLAGTEANPRFQHLLVAPFGLRSRCSDLIEQEIAAARDGRAAGIVLKMNGLEDEEIIGKLYEAGRAGVPVQLIVRGICCLVPGIPGLSESIRARSILDRYLEHWRVYVFESGGEERMFLSSADWMRRNLSHRVEVAFPLYDPEVRRHLREALAIQLADNTKARIVDAALRNAYVPGQDGVVRAQAATREAVRRLLDHAGTGHGPADGHGDSQVGIRHPQAEAPSRPQPQTGVV
jgi:polyphosphate kinase